MWAALEADRRCLLAIPVNLKVSSSMSFCMHWVAGMSTTDQTEISMSPSKHGTSEEVRHSFLNETALTLGY